jgi:hypothetical protein
MVGMSSATPLPRTGEVFFDARGDQRALRLSWHPDADVMVLSLWSQGTCTATFRLAAPDVESFIEALARGLPQQPRGRRHAAPPGGSPADPLTDPLTDPVTGPPAGQQESPSPSASEDFPLTGQYQHPRR